MKPNRPGWWMTVQGSVTHVFDIEGKLHVEGDFGFICLDTVDANWDDWEPVPTVAEVRDLRAAPLATMVHDVADYAEHIGWRALSDGRKIAQIARLAGYTFEITRYVESHVIESHVIPLSEVDDARAIRFDMQKVIRGAPADKQVLIARLSLLCSDVARVVQSILWPGASFRYPGLTRTNEHLAKILIRLLDICATEHIDLEGAIRTIIRTDKET